MTELYAARFARVTQNLAAQGLSQMIVSDPPTIFYLTGIRLNPVRWKEQERFISEWLAMFAPACEVAEHAADNEHDA